LVRITFVGLVGVSLWLSFGNYHRYNKASNWPWLNKTFKRGISIYLVGLGITIATALVIPQHTISFGVLHLIGTALIMASPFVFAPQLAGLTGAIIIVLGQFFPRALLPQLSTEDFWYQLLFRIGIVKPQILGDLDYFPLIPWLGVVLVGIWLGRIVYGYHFQEFQFSTFKLISLAGRHALTLYVLHPVIIGLLLMII